MLILILIGTLMFAYSNQPSMATTSLIITPDNLTDLYEIQHPVIENVTIYLPDDNFDGALIIWCNDNSTAIPNATYWVRIPNFDDFLNNHILNFTEVIWQESVNITLHEGWTNDTVEGEIRAKDNPSDAPVTFIPVNITESDVVNGESATIQNTSDGDSENQVEAIAEFPLVNTSLMFALAILTVMATLAKMKKQKL
ncbi:MAG: hypothetical protein QW270_00415 [Candidatus Bathyarchaeia archaeon]